VAIGSFDGGTLPALYYNTTGALNVAIGTGALRNNTTASNNVAIGYQALQANTTASNNTAVGYQAGYNNTTANYATYLGTGAGLNVTTGAGNCFVGAYTGQSVTTGIANTFVGGLVVGVSNGCGSAMTTGSKNTIIGGYTGNQGGLDIRASSNYIVLSDGDGNPRQWTDGSNVTYRPGNTNAFSFFKSVTGVKTAAASGTSLKLCVIGPTAALSVKVMAISGGSEGTGPAAWSGNITVAYGGGATTAGVSSSVLSGGNITAITVAYDNGGSPTYTINCTLTYTGSAPEIYYVIEGLSGANFIPQ
jgi:hypothetical protein